MYNIMHHLSIGKVYYGQVYLIADCGYITNQVVFVLVQARSPEDALLLQ